MSIPEGGMRGCRDVKSRREERQEMCGMKGCRGEGKGCNEGSREVL